MIIDVEFLNGYWGAGKDREKREWPVSPGRLFSSLVKGCGVGCRSGHCGEQHWNALRAMEKDALPELYCDEAAGLDRMVPQTFVPVNRCGGSNYFDNPHRDSRRHPVVHTPHPHIYFKFNWADDSICQYIHGVLPFVDYLGTSRSKVVMRVVPQIPEGHNFSRYVPDEDGDVPLNAYYEGRLKQLDYHYRTGSAIPLPQRDAYYRKYTGPNGGRAPFTADSGKFVYKLGGRRRVQIQDTAFVSDAFRKELLSVCGKLNIAPPAITSVEPRPHLAYLPLPFVGRYGDGNIMGVAVGIPSGLDEEEESQCHKALAGVRKIWVKDEEYRLMEVPPNNRVRTLAVHAWTAPSKEWVSVTPAEVAHLDSPWEEACYIAKNCQQLGHPKIEKIDLSRYPFIKGSRHARQFVSRNKLAGRSSGAFIHYRIRYLQPMAGFHSLGQGRNFGLGLAMPWFQREGQ